MGEKVTFYPFDVNYNVEEGKPVIYIFGRAISGEQVCILDDSFEPYFYAILKDDRDIDSFCDKVKKLKIDSEEGTAEITKTEAVEKKYLGKKCKAVKLFVKVPSHIKLIRDTIKNWDAIKGIYEYDIPFVRRYLLDKKITPLALLQAEGRLIATNFKVPVFRCEKIEQVGEESIKNPRVLAFDIETYAPSKTIDYENNPIIMLSFYGEDYRKVITWKKFKTDESYIEFVDGEADLISKFKEIINYYKPDVLVGFNSDGFDFPYIITRAKKYKIELDIGIDHSSLKHKKGVTESISIKGIVHADLFRFVKKILGRILETDSYSLQAVAKEVLGEGKHDADIEKMAGIWDNHPEKLEEYCKYNLQDSSLTYRLFLKIWPNIEEFVRLTGLLPYEATRVAFSQLVENYIITQAQHFNEIILNRPHFNEEAERREKRYVGGFVYEPTPGLYHDIIVFDFRSLYPSIITSHNICLSTFNCECCKWTAELVPLEGRKYWFCKKTKGFLATILEDIISRRARIKEILKNKKDVLLEARSQSLKLLANSFYGYLGFSGARWYCFECAMSVTAYGRSYITKVIAAAKKEGFGVIYGDTDSVFLTLNDKKKEDANRFVERINSELPGTMELEYEGHYPSGIFVSTKAGELGAKKRYALVDDNKNMKIRGFETVRRNWSIIGKEVQENVLNIVLKENKPDKALKYVKQVIDDIKNRKILNEKMIIATQLSKGIGDYASIGPHVAAAKKMRDKGEDVGPGSIITFIVAPGTGILRDRVKLPNETKEGEYDPEYYVNNQVIPSVERIFNVLGFKKEDLVSSANQVKLESFFKK